MRKELGKIKSVSFGLGGYQDACIGIHFTLGGESWGVSTGKNAWDKNKINHTDSCQWTEESRSAQYDEILRYVSDLLSAAKVSSVSQLEGIPIEAEFDGMQLKDWRILTEVI